MKFRVFTPLPIFALLLCTLSSIHEVRGAAADFGSSSEELNATPMDSEEGSEDSFLSPARVSLPPSVLPDIPSATTIIRVGNASRAIEALGFGDQLSNLEKHVPDLSSPADIQIRYYSLQPNVASPWDLVDEDETLFDSEENKSNEDDNNQNNDEGLFFSQDKQVSKVNYDDYEIINDPSLYSEVLKFSSSSTTPGPDGQFIDPPVELMHNDKVTAKELGEISNDLLDWAFCMKVMKRIMINNATMDDSTSPTDEKKELTVSPDELLRYGLKCQAFLSFLRTFGNQFMVKSEKKTATNLDLANYDDTVPNMLEAFSPPKNKKVAFHMDNKLIISRNAAPLNDQGYIVGMPVQFSSDGSDYAEESNAKQESSPFTILNYQKVHAVPGGILNGHGDEDNEDAGTGTSDEVFFAQYKIILLGEPKDEEEEEVYGKVNGMDAYGDSEHANDLLKQEDIQKTQSTHCNPCAESRNNLRLAALTLVLIILFLLGFLAVLKCLSNRRLEHVIETTDHYVVNILSQTTPKAVNTEPEKLADASIV